MVSDTDDDVDDVDEDDDKTTGLYDTAIQASDNSEVLFVAESEEEEEERVLENCMVEKGIRTSTENYSTKEGREEICVKAEDFEASRSEELKSKDGCNRRGGRDSCQESVGNLTVSDEDEIQIKAEEMEASGSEEFEEKDGCSRRSRGDSRQESVGNITVLDSEADEREESQSLLAVMVEEMEDGNTRGENKSRNLHQR